MAQRVYLDHAATTPLDPRVAEAMKPFLGNSFGNPSSLHLEGRQARAAVDHAREQVARLLNASADEIVFTASGTESNNLALLGLARASKTGTVGLVTTAVEHPSILEPCRLLERQGAHVTRLRPRPDGIVAPEELSRAISRDTLVVSVMAANNVVGTLQPLDEMAGLARERGVLFHTDAVQAAGKVPLDVAATPVDLLSLSAHKLYGPKGVGALYVRRGVELEPLVSGGGQERGLRSATENVAGIVGLGQAAEVCLEVMSSESRRLEGLRECLLQGVLERFPEAYVIGHRFERLPGHVCLGFSGLEGEALRLLLELDEAGLAVSSGSACSSAHAGQPSHVLTAMGFDPIRARGSLRITLGRFNTAEEVDRFLQTLTERLPRLRPITAHRHPATRP